MIRRRIRMMWPDTRNMRVLGLGFATPFLRPFRDDAERVVAIMPAHQGVLPWPPEGPNLVTLAEDTELPLPDRCFDRVLLVHGVESTEQVRQVMREIWRVLADSGRLMVVVPNRRGIWARLDRTPFGNGRPYTAGQLSRLLRDNLFTPLQSQTALYVPPSSSRMILSSAPAFEEVGQRWFQTFSGVLMVEAAKQIYASTVVHDKPKKARVYVPLPQGLRRAADIRSPRDQI
jgi:SAM-dependent methyltransferase